MAADPAALQNVEGQSSRQVGRRAPWRVSPRALQPFPAASPLQLGGELAPSLIDALPQAFCSDAIRAERNGRLLFQ